MEERVSGVIDKEQQQPMTQDDIISFLKELVGLKAQIEQLYLEAKRIVHIEGDHSRIEELRYLFQAQGALQNQYDELDGAWAKNGQLRPGVIKVFYKCLEKINADLAKFTSQQS